MASGRGLEKDRRAWRGHLGTAAAAAAARSQNRTHWIVVKTRTSRPSWFSCFFYIYIYVNTVVVKSFQTPHACVMSSIVLRISLQSQSAVYFNAATNIQPRGASALFRPTHNWMFQQDGFVPLQHIDRARVQELQRIQFS